MQIDGQGTIRIHRSRSPVSYTGLLRLDLSFFKARNLSLVGNGKLTIGGFYDKTVFKLNSYSLSEPDNLTSQVRIHQDYALANLKTIIGILWLRSCC